MQDTNDSPWNGEPAPEGGASEAWLELKGLQLRVEADELIRRNTRGNVVLRLPLGEIEELAVRRSADPTALAILIIGLGLAVLGCFVSESVILTTILYIVAGLAIVIAMFGCVRTGIDLRVAGQTVTLYSTVSGVDSPDEIAGFVLSLRSELTRRQSRGRGSL